MWQGHKQSIVNAKINVRKFEKWKMSNSGMKVILLFRIVGSLILFVVIPFSGIYLAFGPLHLISLLPAGPGGTIIFVVIMVFVTGECWKDGLKIWKI